MGRLLEMLDLGEFFRDREVLLKINLMKGGPGEEATNTHPAVTAALQDHISAKGSRPRVGDSSGIPGFTDECFDAAGYDTGRFPERQNFDAGPFVRHDFHGWLLREAPVPNVVAEAPVRVSVAKLKTHTLTLFSGVLKNQMGVLPGAVKPALHADVCRTPSALAQVIVDLNRGLPFQLGVMDAVIGREGGGTTTGRPRPARFLAASRDLVALDAVACHLVGIEPHEVETLRLAEEQGLGCASLRHICVMGDELDELHTEFERPGFEWKRFPAVARAAYRLRANCVFPSVIPDRCEPCAECAAACPTDAVMVKDHALIDARKCVNCYACHHRCPKNAIVLRCRRWMRPIFRRRAAGLDLSKLGQSET